ncbi:unnamed protein product [Orchesella dallaii]|uniref:Pupal cuticle protein n=1 Tax=Orchesella dallaii TaxID=48710 RepID=A0ABP1RWL9_9HEXA
MKVAIVFALFFVAVCARPQQDVQVVNLENENLGDGNYKFTYALSDGTNREESGALKQIGDVQAQTQEGVISWTSPEGQVSHVTKKQKIMQIFNATHDRIYHYQIILPTFNV